MNLKKIGMTALAASLVSTSVFAGEMSVAGSASINMENHSSTALSEAKTFSMGNQLTFSGSGELDNGLTVSLSFVLDQNDDSTTAGAAYSGGPFDSHSVSIGSDAMGTIKFSGEGGASTASAIDTTAAGDMWDNFNSNGGDSVTDSLAGDNSIFYTLPSMVDGLGLTASYKPQTSTTDSGIGYGISYTGVEGLSVSYAMTNIETYAAATTGDQTAWKASYAYGPVTLAASNTEYDVGTLASDDETRSYKVSYTVSDAISIGYGTEEIKQGGVAIDAEYTGFSASYTAGGMTLSAAVQDGKNIAHTTAAAGQVDFYSLGLSFAF